MTNTPPAPDHFKNLDFNPEFVAAFEAIEHSSRHIFVTGKAGTGKSTLLQYFRHKTQKKIAVVAPTGVAAINIKGQTIHSFFSFRPDVTTETVGDVFLSKKRRELFKSLQTLVIDEISMVRADLLDCVDIFLRIHGPDPSCAFGGVQMVFFGDLYQLPPVIRRDEEQIFRSFYKSPYFFSAKIFEQIDLEIVELKQIYRQKDNHFIELLNAIRHNKMEDHHIRKLNSRLHSHHQVDPDDFYICLTTTNQLAEQINLKKLAQLPGNVKSLDGVVAGEFEKKNLPTPEKLDFKIGSQIMMLNNDPEKRWVNGSIGKIVEIIEQEGKKDVIMVQLSNGSIVDVMPFTWEIYQYYFDETMQALNSQVVGYFTQYPMKLAWAVTIHKSQGQTFERVIIDIGYGTFAHGHVYVALSRCTTLEGIILKQPILPKHIKLDDIIAGFLSGEKRTRSAIPVSRPVALPVFDINAMEESS